MVITIIVILGGHASMGGPQQSYHRNSLHRIAFWEMYFRLLKDFLQGRCGRSCAFIGYGALRHHVITNSCSDTRRRCEFEFENVSVRESMRVFTSSHPEITVKHLNH